MTNRTQSIQNYFQSGFILTNKSITVLTIKIVLSLLPYLITLIKYPKFEWVTFVISILLMIYSFGFTLSIPLFLESIQKKNRTPVRTILTTSLHTTKRIILPGILAFLLFNILLIVYFVLLILIFRPDTNQINTFIQSIGTEWHPILFFPTMVIYFFEFTPFYYSLENHSLFKAMKHSVITSLRNLKYISVIIGIGAIYYILSITTPTQSITWSIVRTAIGAYMALWITSSSYYYYRSRVKSHNTSRDK